MKRWMVLGLVAGAALAGGAALHSNWARIDVPMWQRQVSPGPLSPSHAWRETTCVACHTPVKSAEAAKCIGCHATNTALLQRAPTAFHAVIGTCSACHLEHTGASVRPVTMDHIALANIGLKVVAENLENASNRRLVAWVRLHEASGASGPAHPRVTSREAALDCVTCHGTKDRHQALFGRDCASCHATGSWTIPEFRHPSIRSVDCVQCHQAPPSHHMLHFQMVSQSVAGQPGRAVEQCFACHQTTSWNDIRQVGWYKHH